MVQSGSAILIHVNNKLVTRMYSKVPKCINRDFNYIFKSHWFDSPMFDGVSDEIKIFNFSLTNGAIVDDFLSKPEKTTTSKVFSNFSEPSLSILSKF